MLYILGSFVKKLKKWNDDYNDYLVTKIPANVIPAVSKRESRRKTKYTGCPIENFEHDR